MRLKTLAILVLVGAASSWTSKAQADGTRPTYLKNATADPNIGFWVDNGGRGLRKDVDTTDGRAARVPVPGEVVTATETICLMSRPSGSTTRTIRALGVRLRQAHQLHRHPHHP